MSKVRWSVGVAFAVLVTAPIGSSAAAGATGPEAIQGEYLGVSPAVRGLEPAGAGTASSVPRQNPLAGGAAMPSDSDAPDPLLRRDRRAEGRTPAPILNFDGTGNTCSCTPPDTTGDVGPNHYIQMVNATKVAIYNKSGTLLAPPFELSTLFPSASSCNPNNDGDPQVLYDPLANRWVLAQFAINGGAGPFFLCFAVSQTPDPLGAYFTYAVPTPEFPDYFKVGVWPTGYYVSTNENTYTAYALDRAAMLSGTAPTAIRFPGETNFLMPADVDGPNAPDPQGGLFYTFKDNAFPAHGGGVDRLELFRLNPDYTTPSNSTFTNVATIPISSFTYTVCGFFVLDCIPQQGTAEGLDAVSEWPMQHLAYRRFPDHETLLGNFTVDVGSDRAGIRWFELRNTGSGYTLFQEGTQSPGTEHRFMGSITMDGSGDIALGYSVSSSTMFPAIRYATRTPSDPPGTLQAEQTLQAGGGSQTSTANRWGDYSAMAVDPADDCTFWYTNEYYSATSAANWKTRIGTFKDPSCTGPPPPPNRQLDVVTAGTGSGFVDSSPAGVDCGLNTPGSHADCSESYAGGTAVTLTAHPDANTDFAGFSGGGCSGTDPCTVTMDAARSVTATFAQKASPPTPPSPPSNDFSIDGVKRNTKNGTATMTVTVAGAGALSLTGKQVKPVRPIGAARRSALKPVTGPGPVTLKIKPKGKAKKKLKKKGVAKVKVTVTFTPTGGTPASQTTKVKLKKKLK